MADLTTSSAVDTFMGSADLAAMQTYLGTNTVLAARVEGGTTKDFPSGSLTFASFDTEIRDDGSFADLGTNATRLTIPSGQTGWYLVQGQLFVGTTATGGASAAVTANLCAVVIQKNGTDFIAQFRDEFNSVDPGFSLSSVAYLAAGDYLEIGLFHNDGVTLKQRIDTGQKAYLAIAKIGSSSNSGAQLDTANLFTKAQRVTPVVLSISSGAITIDCNASNIFRLSLTANVTSITINNLAVGANFSLHITQDATGGRTVAGWPTSVKWAGGIAPTITSTANAKDILSFESADGTTIQATYAQNFS